MTLSGIGELPLFKRRNQSTEEWEALLDLLPHPTLISDNRTGRILFANTQLVQLTSYTRKELLELDLNTLLPDLSASPAQGAQSKNGTQQTLVKRNSSTMPVVIKAHELGGSDNWWAITVQAASGLEDAETKVSNEKQRWEAMHLLSLAPQQTEIASAYRQLLLAGSLLTGAENLGLYVQSNDGLRLEAVSGSEIDFPANLNESDLGHLRIPKIWQPGKPLVSKLNKAAHAAKATFMATSPLDITQPDNGLVVAADLKKPPHEQILTMLQIIAGSAATVALHAQSLGKLRNKLELLARGSNTSTVIQENARDGILLTDSRLNAIAMNPAAELMLGYGQEEILGRPASEVIICSPDLLAEMDQALLGKPVEAGERKLRRRDGSEFLALVRMAPIFLGEKTETLVILISDLSEHEAFHIRSQQLQQRAWLGEVTAIFAHEVRNPINNISTGLQLMQISLPEQDPMQDQVKRLLEDCDRLDHRMKSVLNFSRNLEHSPEALNIADFCRQQIERWRPRMARKNIKDTLIIAENLPMIFADSRSLDQVFTNLITNSIQALDGQEDGFIAIKITRNIDSPEYVDIHISDNGPGIPDDLRKRVFDPFFTTKENEGTGLGLAITRRIIIAHKGHIEVDSFPGGTLFKLQLPIADISEEGNS